MTDTSADNIELVRHRPMAFAEFVIVIAAIMALNPLAMDMMLPALPDIGSAFHIGTANRVQMVLSAFVIGFGVGQFAIGPLSDSFGRRPVLLSGMVLYVIASLLALAAPSFETLLLARVLEGLGTAATRVIATSIVRDCYAGRRMASVVSLAMMVFIAVPVVAPAFGQAVMLLTQWRGIFVVLTIYGVIALLWTVFRLPETLPETERKPFNVAAISAAFRATLTNRQTLGYALAASGIFGAVLAYVLSSQQLFTGVYHLGHYFPLAFAAISATIAVAGFLNARLVGRLGMRKISHSALVGCVMVALACFAAALLGALPLWLFMVLSAAMMFSFGLMFANFTALAMEPQRANAGTASSLYGSITTLLGMAAGAVVGQAFDGTPLPFATGFLACTATALAIVLITEKGRLFHGAAKPV
ncbi:Putative Drug resistance transporter, Bcr/CflA family [Bradyrhizobium sp. ORS 278]|uniref:multidrug effflux MFS transporter n=1 Tax=Bradyrhizobium sp. (strain ORS 278) TaxID=114615 RepID=UPI00015088DA|nr:multidrug effflux MFS transporter [Bradyrhizobium sp. ORS 278]CAL79215.1 Putative Drug resistance transporter, Bcr/CflA family [Bradyrhizobium sp. ORS 278]